MRFDFASLSYRPAILSTAPTPISIQPETPPSPESPSFKFDPASFLELWRERSSIMSVEVGLSVEDSDYEEAFQVVWSRATEQIDAPTGLSLLPKGAGCCYCGGRFVIERLDGLECWDCQRMAWMNLGGSIVRADFAEVVL